MTNPPIFTGKNVVQLYGDDVPALQHKELLMRRYAYDHGYTLTVDGRYFDGRIRDAFGRPRQMLLELEFHLEPLIQPKPIPRP